MDTKYSLLGDYLPNCNGQAVNTPVVIFTVGSSRNLFFRKRITKLSKKGRRCWEIDKSSTMSVCLKEGSMMILHPDDEKPHIDQKTGEEVHFQHGNVKITDTSISIAFVFRISSHTCICDSLTNIVKVNPDTMEFITCKEKDRKVNRASREKLYNEFDKDSYHATIKDHFNKYF